MLHPESGTTTISTTFMKDNPKPQNLRKPKTDTQNQKMEPPNSMVPKVAETTPCGVCTWALFVPGWRVCGGEESKVCLE